MLHQERYDQFVKSTSYLDVMRRKGLFEIAPNISKETGDLVSSLFHLDQEEGILLIRENIGKTYLVITTVGLYHNVGAEPFNIKWDDLSFVKGTRLEYRFYRNKRIVFYCAPDFILFGYPKSSFKRNEFLDLIKTFPQYKYTPSPEAIRIRETFRDAMSSLPQYMTNYDSYLQEDFSYEEYLIPETETILHNRSPYVMLDTDFYVTDNALYYIDDYHSEKSFRICWNSIYSVRREGKEVCFYDKSGNRVGLPINHVVQLKKGIFESEEHFYNDVDAVVEVFSKVLSCVTRTSDKFIRPFGSYQKPNILSIESISDNDFIYKPRCPFCGSDSYDLADIYYKKERKAQAMHDLQDVAISAISVALGGKPGRSVYESSVTPEYICHDCHKTWEMDWREKE